MDGDVVIKTKTCSICNNEYPYTEEYFYRQGKNLEYLQSYCKECQKEKVKNRYKNNQQNNNKNNDKNYKICSKCNKELPANGTYFNKSKNSKDGLTLKCKKCIENKYNYIVYMHYNKINNKIYIGRTKSSLKERWASGNGYRTNIKFSNDIKKYGTKNFEHEIIASGLTEDEANNFEIILIDKLNATNPRKGYNIHIGGENGQKGLFGKGTQAKKIYCDGLIFNSMGECANYYGIEKSLLKGWLKGKNIMPPIFIELGLKFVDNEENGLIKTKSLRSKRVICNGKIFNSIRKCSEYYNINKSTLKTWLDGRNGMPQKYIDLGLKYYDEETKLKNPTLTKMVICEGMIFESIKKCSEYYNISYSVLINWLKGVTKTPQEFQDKGLKYYKN